MPVWYISETKWQCNLEPSKEVPEWQSASVPVSVCPLKRRFKPFSQTPDNELLLRNEVIKFWTRYYSNWPNDGRFGFLMHAPPKPPEAEKVLSLGRPKERQICPLLSSSVLSMPEVELLPKM